MRLQFKFILLAAILTISVSVLSINSFIIVRSLVERSSELHAIRVLKNKHQHKIISFNDVNSTLWETLYLQNQGFKQETDIIKKMINDKSTNRKILDIEEKYEQNLLKEMIPIFYTKFFNKINSEAIFPFNDSLKELDQLFDNYIEDINSIIINMDSPDIKNNIKKLKKIESKIIILNQLLTEDINQSLHLKKVQVIKYIGYESVFTLIVAIISTLLVCLLPLFFRYKLFSPLSKIINIMSLIVNNNNNNEEIPFTQRSDEIGDIANALKVFRINSIEKEKLEEEAKQQIQKSSEEKQKSLLIFANNFENSVKGIVDTVASAVTKINTTARKLEQLANHTKQETTQLSTTSNLTNNNIQGVSKATSEFNSAVNEISTQVTNSLEYARRAAEQTDQVNNVVLELENKASAISGIIDIINNITSQIDLLALNATIEAARAGDMGKGFAVVANEVKALATQTSKATEQINIQISGIQSSTNQAVVSIQEITESVKTINQNSASIASAVEEQSVSTSYIAESISQVASMSDSVSESVEKVTASSNHSGETASEMLSSAENLLSQSSLLQSEVDNFLSSLKSS